MSETYKTLKAKIEIDLAREQVEIEIFKQCRAVVAKFEGKQNNRRILTALKKQFPEATVCESYGTSINIWGKCFGPLFPHYGKHFNLGMPGSSVFSLEDFDKGNICHGEAAVQRNVERSSVLANTGFLAKMAEEIDAYHALEKSLCARVNNRPWEYTVRRLLKGEQVELE